MDLVEDIILKSPLWALLILTIWGIIAFVMFWTLLNVIKPSIDQRMKERTTTTLINTNNLKTVLINNNVAGK